ncbi:MAG: RNA 2',3'-cyclic phosphodiesterase [Gemmobacter sp.]
MRRRGGTIRAFVALPIPEDLRAPLTLLQFLLPLPRRVPPENLHLTLAFLGEISPEEAEEVHHALDSLRLSPVPVHLRGVGMFGGERPHSVHALAVPDPALKHLARKVAQAARGAGVTIAARRFVPHVTLGRLDPAGADLPRLERAVAAEAGFVCGPALMDRFCLMRSRLHPDGARYETLAEYPLGG